MIAATYFASVQALRTWLQEKHESAEELWIGFYKTSPHPPSVAYQDALDEALCFGWIDGVRRSIDPARYAIRFFRRRPSGHWSRVNLERAHELERQGRMTGAGRKALAGRDARRSSDGSQVVAEAGPALDPAYEAAIRSNSNAWAFLNAQPPSYRSAVASWIMGAKKTQTRERRLTQVIEQAASGRRIAAARPQPARGAPG